MDSNEEFALELDTEIEEVRKELRRRAELLAEATSARGIEFWLESQKLRAEELSRLLNQRSEMLAKPRPEDRPDQVLDQQPSTSR